MKTVIFVRNTCKPAQKTSFGQPRKFEAEAEDVVAKEPCHSLLVRQKIEAKSSPCALDSAKSKTIALSADWDVIPIAAGDCMA